jgi:hypothetical protein
MRHPLAGTFVTALALAFAFVAASLAGSMTTTSTSSAYLAAREMPKVNSILVAAQPANASEEHCTFSNARECEMEQ